MFGWVKNLIIKKAAKKFADKLDLQEGPMEEGKSWWKSKGVISGIAAVLLGTYEAVRINLAPQVGWHIPEIPPVLFTVLGALGIYSRVVAGKVIK
jgi:hypothetical protein